MNHEKHENFLSGMALATRVIYSVAKNYRRLVTPITNSFPPEQIVAIASWFS